MRVPDIESLARQAALAVDAKKAQDVLALDVRDIGCACEALVICTAPNARLADAVTDEVELRMRQAFGLEPVAIEGRREGRWIVVDYGALVVHVLSPEARAFYRLERLWGDAARIAVELVD